MDLNHKFARPKIGFKYCFRIEGEKVVTMGICWLPCRIIDRLKKAQISSAKRLNVPWSNTELDNRRKNVSRTLAMFYLAKPWPTFSMHWRYYRNENHGMDARISSVTNKYLEILIRFISRHISVSLDGQPEKLCCLNLYTWPFDLSARLYTWWYQYGQCYPWRSTNSKQQCYYIFENDLWLGNIYHIVYETC